MIPDSARRLFIEAMKDGYVRLKIINMLLSGVAGSGKTSLKLLLTDQLPLQQRNSTPCMEKPVRVDIRSVSSAKFKSTGRAWVEISQEKLLSLLAQMIARHPKKSPVQSVGSKVTKALQEMTLSTKSTSTPGSSISKDTSNSTPVIQEAISETVESIVNEIAQKLKNIEPEDESVVAKTVGDELSSMEDQEGGELFDSTWVYISDCGGQPQFHDISPLFIRHISVAAIVFRLTIEFSIASLSMNITRRVNLWAFLMHLT